MLPIIEAGFHEALEDVVAGNSECIVGIMHLVGLEIDLTARAKMSQTQLVGLMTLAVLW